MRARLAIAASGIQVEIREIVLKHKPAHMLSVSPKGTVPVLITTDDNIVDESLDIMHWALQQNDPNEWLTLTVEQQQNTTQLFQNNDGPFKHWLDKYKYADRHPEQTETYYRQQGELTLETLEQKLTENDYLVGNRLSVADIALLPFIRQFASIDRAWFDAAPYPQVQTWLNHFLNSDAFNNIMAKLPSWQENAQPRYFPDLDA
jgi:glutathione S-transferase